MRNVTLLLILAACGGSAPAAEPTSPEPIMAPEPTFADDVQHICDAPDAVAAEMASTPAPDRAGLLARHIEAGLRTERGHAYVASLAEFTPREKAAALRSVESAPTPCALADLFDEMAAQEAASAPMPEIEGSGAAEPQRDRDAIAAVIQQNVNQVRYCYERQLAQDPELAGSLRVRFTIAAEGSVSAVEIAEGLHAEVDTCVKARVESWSFPAAEGVTVVTYPFVFTTGTD